MGNLAGYKVQANAQQALKKTGEMPDGDYNAIINAAPIKVSQSGGTYINMEFQITDEPYDRRKFWVNIHMENQSASALQISEVQMNKIIVALDMEESPDDSSAFEGHPIVITLATKKGEQKIVHFQKSPNFVKKDTQVAQKAAAYAQKAPTNTWAKLR